MNKQIQYNRVIPRDFFNESKLLKCFGTLALKVLDFQVPEGVVIEIDNSDGDAFDVILTLDGSLTLRNYTTKINGHAVIFKTTYNSKSAYPFYCEYNDEDHEVFDDNGNFQDEFIEFSLSLNTNNTKKSEDKCAFQTLFKH